MTDEQYRLRVNLEAREIEIEGSKDFVQEYWAKLEPLIDRTPALRDVYEEQPAPIGTAPNSDNGASLPSSFGEYRNSFPKHSQIDAVLIAGLFLQSQSGESVFTTGEAKALLSEHGVKISNASDCVGRLAKSGKVFKDGAKTYRVSEQGAEFIAELRAKK